MFLSLRLTCADFDFDIHRLNSAEVISELMLNFPEAKELVLSLSRQKGIVAINYIN